MMMNPRLHPGVPRRPAVWPRAVVLAGWLAIGGGVGSAAHAATLAGWDVHALPGGANAFGASPLPASVGDANLIVGGLTRGAGIGTTGTAAARGWGGTDWTSVSAAAAVAAGDTINWTLVARPGFQLSIGAISRLDYRRSSTGATSGVLQAQVGSGAAFNDLATLAYTSTAAGGASLPAIDLSGVAALQNVPAGVTVTLRLLNFGASAAGGTWYLYDAANTVANDLEVSGSVTPAGAVPTDGACGAANGQLLTQIPSVDLCSAGSASAVSGNGPWSWTCSGSNGGVNATCAANRSALGMCF